MSTIHKCDMCGTEGARLSSYAMRQNPDDALNESDIANFRLTAGLESKSITKDVCVGCIGKAGWGDLLVLKKANEPDLEELLVSLLADKVADQLA